MSAKRNGENFQSNNVGICAFYLASSCRNGRKCRFLHDIPEELIKTESKSLKREDLCYFFLKGKCNDGLECRRFHGEPPSFNGTIRRVCTYITQGGCNRGKLCSYIHDLPANFMPVNIVNTHLSSGTNEVPQVVINASDDVQSMANGPKLCRFYRRGMCFFGDNCTNFHDKPIKDVEALLSDLRKDEALKESAESNSPNENCSNSDNPFVLLTNNESLDLHASQTRSLDCSNESNEKESNTNEMPDEPNVQKSADSEELPNSSFGTSSMTSMAVEASCSTSYELITVSNAYSNSNRPLNSKKSSNYFKTTHRRREFNERNNSANSQDFVRIANSTAKECHAEDFNSLSKSSTQPMNHFSRTANNCSNAEEQASAVFHSNTASKSEDFTRDRFSKSTEVKRAYSLNSNQSTFNRSSKSREFTNSKFYSKSSISNGNRTNSRQFFNSTYCSKPRSFSRSHCANNLECRELPENAHVSSELLENSYRSALLKDNEDNSLRSTNQFENAAGTETELLSVTGQSNFSELNTDSAEAQSSLTTVSNRRQETRTNCSMTRKQSKSQRKPSRKRTRSPLNYTKHF